LGSTSFESGSEFFLSSSADNLDLREFELGVLLYNNYSESQRFVSSNIFSLIQLGSSENLDILVIGSVVTRHFHMELGDSSVQRHISEFLIDVMGQSTGRVFQSHTIGLNKVGIFFINLLRKILR
jgi:hypothetical protein